jgi:flagellar basal body-associated protein FliL
MQLDTTTIILIVVCLLALGGMIAGIMYLMKQGKKKFSATEDVYLDDVNVDDVQEDEIEEIEV